MRLLHSLALPVLWSLLGAAAPANIAYKVKETVAPPRGWVATDDVSPGHTIELHIGLPQSNFAELEAHLYAVRCVRTDTRLLPICTLTTTQ